MISISLVTPSYNKAPFLEAALRSVLDQSYPNLEYVVVDGGSQDGSINILERYRASLSQLVIEPDGGMYDALTKGFAQTHGDVMGYLGADDLHMPWTLSVIGEIFDSFPKIDWITTMYPLTVDKLGRVIRARCLPPPSSRSFWQGDNLPGFSWWSNGWIQQESTFWRRTLWEQSGGFDSSLRWAGDFDLWCRFMKLADPVSVAAPLAAFRRHGEQISATQAEGYKHEALLTFKRHGGQEGGRIISRLSELKRRVGLKRSGSILHYDSTSESWHFSV
ncbi:MAG: glycosyltransferase [Alphaproteobacteria bacterium]|nr:glycosyltransferase [Alphaproteobacteria bacterium]